MIRPQKSAVFRLLFRRHVRRRLRRHFRHLWIAGLADLSRHLDAGPVLVVSNHTAWWDGLLVLHLCESVRPSDGYAMMDADNLRRFPFFARLGAFGVEAGDPRDGARAVRFAAATLDRPGRLLWIFPQGDERPVDAPLEFVAGAAAVARAARRATVVPAGLRYHHGASERPEVLMAFGPPVPADGTREAVRRAQAEAVAAQLGRIADALVAADLVGAGFADVLGRHGGRERGEADGEAGSGGRGGPGSGGPGSGGPGSGGPGAGGGRERPDLRTRMLGRLLALPRGRRRSS